MALKITAPIESISVVSAASHDVERINSVERGYKALRQDSKAPTFRPYLSGNMENSRDQLWILR